MNFEQLLKLTVSVIADMTFISVLNDHTFYIHFVFAIIFKKNLYMNVDFYFIEFSAMIVKKFNEKNIFHLTWNFSTCKKHLSIKYLQQWFCPSSYWCNDMVLISLSLTFLLKLVYQLHLHLVLKMAGVLVGYSLFTRYSLVLE